MSDARDPETAMRLLVRQESWEAEGIISLVLCRADGGELPGWEPGAHLDVVLPSGLTRQYSLCGDLDDRMNYRIAVLYEPTSRGGSREIFETALVGHEITIRGPRNHFRLVDAPRYVFIAGGIGITPIIPMIQSVERAGMPWSLTYGGRRRATMAFVDELVEREGGAVDVVAEDELGFPDLDALVRGAGNAAVYSCGPSGLLTALQQRCGESLDPEQLHIERFTVSGEAPSGVAEDGDAFAVFEVALRKSAKTVVVPANRTVLDVVREVVPGAMFSCEEGYCGACEVRVLEGIPDHRDTVLTERERAANNTMMICVSRSKSPSLVLDI
jgi:ferredoxin-NADP reductase